MFGGEFGGSPDGIYNASPEIGRRGERSEPAGASQDVKPYCTSTGQPNTPIYYILPRCAKASDITPGR